MKHHFEPLLSLAKENESGPFKKPQEDYLGEKEVEKISAMRNTVVHDAENIEPEPINEAKSGKETVMNQVPTFVIEYTK